MKILYIDPFSGVSGDMFLGALLDLGMDQERWRRQLDLLPMGGYALSFRKCTRAGIRATRLEVTIDHSHEQPPRDFRTIRQMLEGSKLSSWVRERSIRTFSCLAEAEGAIHGVSPDDVHFHEVGAVDSVVDVVGTWVALEQWMPAHVYSSPINLGSGTLQCQHGLYPVPGPATQRILQGLPTFSTDASGELATPTGAALIATLVQQFVPRPLMRIVQTGYGAGSRDLPGMANVLRITLGESGPEASTHDWLEEETVVLRACIDDMNPQIYGHFQQEALSRGALDVYFTPILMKKGRPATELSVICRADVQDSLTRLIFAETTTLGIRYSIAHRKTLQREHLPVDTEYGRVTVKVAKLDGELMNFAPEYEDCRRLAREKGVALKVIQRAAVKAYLQLSSDDAPGGGRE